MLSRSLYSHCRLLLLVALMGCLCPPEGASAGPLRMRETRLYVNHSAAPPSIELLANNVCMLDPECQTDLSAALALGHTLLARLPVVAVTPNSAAGESALLQSMALPENNEFGWNRVLLNVLHPGWAAEMIEVQAKRAAVRGFSGFVIEGADLLGKLSAQQPEVAAKQRAAFIHLVRGLRQRFPDKLLVLEGGVDLLPELRRSLHGVFLHGVFRELDERGVTRPVTAELEAVRERCIRVLQSLDLKIYAAELGDPADARANTAAAARLQRIGCATFITGSDLSGQVFGPHLAEPTEVLVLHGWDPETKGTAVKPARQTWSAQTLEPVLRWHGLTPRYLSFTDWHAGNAEAARLLHPKPAGIVLDPDLSLPEASQEALAGWLQLAVTNEVPLLLAGQPFTSATAWSSLAAALDLGGSGREHAAAALSGYRADWFTRGRLPEQRPLVSLDLQAGISATPILGYRLDDGAGRRAHFDACFIASWGGAWLTRSAPLDPFRFLEAALQRQNAAPVPDNSTLAGLQIYLSTVQGLGFCEPSWLPGGRLCGEVLRDELEKVPALPVTVALAEADIRGWSQASEPAEAGRYEALARVLFALPQVEPASNSFSRPLCWQAGAFQPGPLRAVIPERQFSLERETIGSFDFLHRLLPPSKKMSFLLWPEGAQPTLAAAELLASRGGWQLPGSWQSGWHLGGARPDDISIEATPRPAAPGSAGAIAEAWLRQHTTTPGSRRTGPVHLAYALADLQKPANVQALRQIWTWCAEQPLHPMTASAYARFRSDCANVRIHTLADNHWRIFSTGRAVTLRLPADRGLPDLSHSFGVCGYSQQNGQLYLHLSGRELSEIVLAPAGSLPPQPHLVEASRTVEFMILKPENTRFRVPGRDPVVVTLGGLVADAWYQVNASGHQTRLQANASGCLTFQAPPLASVQLQPSQTAAKPYAAR